MSEEKKQLSRRDFLKFAGLTAAAVQAGGMVAGGIAAGKNSESYTGWESHNPGTQKFNRKPFEVAYPNFEPIAEVRRPSHLTDYVFGRVATFDAALQANPDWKIGDPVADLGFPPPLVAFYEKFPERLEWDYKTFTETIPNNMKDRAKFMAPMVPWLTSMIRVGMLFVHQAHQNHRKFPTSRSFPVANQCRSVQRIRSSSRALNWPPSLSRTWPIYMAQPWLESLKPISTGCMVMAGEEQTPIMTTPRCPSIGSMRSALVCRWNGMCF